MPMIPESPDRDACRNPAARAEIVQAVASYGPMKTRLATRIVWLVSGVFDHASGPSARRDQRRDVPQGGVTWHSTRRS
jgi:hypothetical protein